MNLFSNSFIEYPPQGHIMCQGLGLRNEVKPDSCIQDAESGVGWVERKNNTETVMTSEVTLVLKKHNRSTGENHPVRHRVGMRRLSKRTDSWW